MPDRRPTIALFAEDLGHEKFIGATVARLAALEGLPKPRIIPVCARGGHGKAIAELKLFQKMTAGHNHDILIVAIDADVESWNTVHRNIEAIIGQSQVAHVIIGCPEPHIERWYLADPPSLKATLGVNITSEKRRNEKGFYKSLLKRSLQDAGHVVRLGGIEFAEEIVACMDFFNAGKNEPSLKHFLDEVRTAFRKFAHDHKNPP